MRTRMIVTCLVAAIALAQGPVLALGQSEGIKVHGRWLIEIRNTDGSVASRNEFNNALTAEGQRLLASLLMRGRVLAGWRVRVASSGCEQNACYLYELKPGAAAANGPLSWSNLQLGGGGTGAVTLSGSYTNFRQGVITLVQTQVADCFSDLSHQECFASSGASTQGWFTEKTLPTPIAVGPGQIVQVTVTLSFS